MKNRQMGVKRFKNRPIVPPPRYYYYYCCCHHHQ